MTIDKTLDDAKNGKLLNKEEAIAMLNAKNNSSDLYKIISLANEKRMLTI
ncbi:MAG: hypothetical protein MUO60_17255 [Clostridiaceae bacterium]|nr:hypothetical protein [Clostridiaceae bacterium]